MRSIARLVLFSAILAASFFTARAFRDKYFARGPHVDTNTIAPAAERRAIPLDVDRLGKPTLVNIVEFGDYQCPFCGKIQETLEKLENSYGDDLAVSFRHYPLSIHPDAPLASRAALAAGEQGAYRQMHEKLFANQTSLKRADLEGYAEELGLDVTRFMQDMEGEATDKRVQADTELALRAGVAGLPAVFINGRMVAGARPYEVFATLVEEELMLARRHIARGIARENVYAAITADAKPLETKPVRPPPPPSPLSKERYKVPIGDSPRLGAQDAKVTVVAFAEFECPYSAQLIPTLRRLIDTSPDVAVVFKHFPLRSHPKAMPAALAAEAARAQRAFWPAADQLFAGRIGISPGNLKDHGRKLGLDTARFLLDFKSADAKRRVDADVEAGERLGVVATPTIFVNGRRLVGNHSPDTIQSIVREEIGAVDGKLQAGLSRSGLYDALVADGLERAETPKVPSVSAETYRVDIGEAPVRGGPEALVTIVQFSDFECAFCAKVEPDLERIIQAYPGKVRVVWKDFPLPGHKMGWTAATVARLAHERGLFWKIHRSLFARSREMDTQTIEELAVTAGLDRRDVQRAIRNDSFKREIEADIKAGDKLGIGGTPAFFINGRYVDGALPFEVFRTIVDDELKRAEALTRNGVSPGEVYERLMREALSTPVLAANANGRASEPGTAACGAASFAQP